MAQNIEVKAYLRNKSVVIEALRGLTDDPGLVIKQNDTFFISKTGRLKLRQIEGSHSELIYYDRLDSEGPKLSNYEKYESTEHSNLLSVLSKALEVRGVVKKVRHLYMVGQTRVHIDEVEGLGQFLELEVVLKPDQTAEEGQQVAEDIMTRLGIGKSDLIAGAYMDILRKR